MSSVNHGFRPGIIKIVLLSLVLAAAIVEVGAWNDLARKQPSVELRASRNLITYPCPPCMHSISRSCPTDFDPRVHLLATVDGFNKEVDYSYSVTGGQVVGEGREVIWDLSNRPPGFYKATVEAHDKKRHANGSAVMTIANCGDCVTGDCHCPAIAVYCYDTVKAGTAITCKVMMTGAHSRTFDWSARTSNGESLSARLRNNGEYISIPTDDLAGRTVYVTVDVSGLDPTCNRSASGSTVVKP